MTGKKEEADLCNSKEMVGKYKLLVKNAKRTYSTSPKEFKTKEGTPSML